MITGKVNRGGDAVIQLRVQGPEGPPHEITAIVDTGFNGWLTLPKDLITSLRLPFRGSGRATLADGREILFDTFEGTVFWDGRPRQVSIQASDSDPLVGMGLLYGYELNIHVVEGGDVVIRNLSGEA